jgi:class 3 adenylate cyclase
MPTAERRLAVVFADVSGSTKLYEAIGDHEAHRVIAQCLDTLRTAALEFRGRVIKFIGDELLCVFDDADGAISAATQMQTRLATQRATDATVPAIRVGVAAGPVLEDAGDVFGDTVNVASRIANIAAAGQVLTNRQTAESLPPAIRATCRALPPVELRGVEGRVAIVEVLWNTEATLTMVIDGREIADEGGRALVLSHNGKDVRIDEKRRAARIGRDPSNDLVVRAPCASRWHARVLLQHDNFVLIDESANGTYLRVGEQAEVHLQRDQTLLLGSGLFSLGESTSASDAAIVVFSVR